MHICPLYSKYRYVAPNYRFGGVDISIANAWQILIAETVNRWPMTPVLPSPAGHLSPGNHEKHNFCKTVKTVVKLRVLEFRGTTCILEYMSMGVV